MEKTNRANRTANDELSDSSTKGSLDGGGCRDSIPNGRLDGRTNGGYDDVGRSGDAGRNAIRPESGKRDDQVVTGEEINGKFPSVDYASSSAGRASHSTDRFPSGGGVPSSGSFDGIVTRDARGRVEDLKRVEGEIFKGVKHGKEYYQAICDSGTFSQLAFVNGELAGAICCYIQTKGRKNWMKKEIQISTLGVLEKFRCQGVGSKLMRHVLNSAGSDPLVERILLNVHSKDENAMRFYKKFGFEILSYAEMSIGGSFVMERRFRIIT